MPYQLLGWWSKEGDNIRKRLNFALQYFTLLSYERIVLVPQQCKVEIRRRNWYDPVVVVDDGSSGTLDRLMMDVQPGGHLYVVE